MNNKGADQTARLAPLMCRSQTQFPSYPSNTFIHTKKKTVYSILTLNENLSNYSYPPVFCLNISSYVLFCFQSPESFCIRSYGAPLWVSLSELQCKNQKHFVTQNNYCNYPKIGTASFYYRVMVPRCRRKM